MRTQRNFSLICQATPVSNPLASSSASAASCFAVRFFSFAFKTAQRTAVGILTSLASDLRTSSRALVNSCTTWNQSTVTDASGKVSPTAARKAGDMSQTTSAILLGLPLCSARKSLNRRRSEEHTSELQSLMRISYAVFCLKQKQTSKHSLLTSLGVTVK